MMHDKIQQIFTEHASPTQVGKKQMQDMVSPALDQCTKAQQQVAIFRQLLIAAEMQSDVPGIEGKFEKIHQTLGAIDTIVKDHIHSGRRLVLAFAQLDRYLEQAKGDLCPPPAAELPSAAPEPEL